MTGRNAPGRLLAAVFLSTLVAGVGCGQGDSGQRTQAADATRAAARATSGAATQDLPPTGRSLVQSTGVGYTTLANDAPREQVLRELEKLAGFRLEFEKGGEPSAPITLRAVDLPLEEALSQALRGVPYALHYGVDPGDGSPILERVSVGLAARAARANGRPKPAEARAEEDDAERRAMVEALREQREEFERKMEELERKRAEAFERLEDPNPEVRADAARWIDSDSLQALEALADVIQYEVDPTVRAAAAESLGESADEITAVGLLLQALEDPNPEVVLAALDSIEFVGDETAIPALQPLLQHRNEDVRKRTLEAIEFLE